MKIFQKYENFLKICLIKCLKGHKSLGSLCNVVKALIINGVRPTKGPTMSPIELFWTAKKTSFFDPFVQPRSCIQDQLDRVTKQLECRRPQSFSHLSVGRSVARVFNLKHELFREAFLLLNTSPKWNGDLNFSNWVPDFSGK